MVARVVGVYGHGCGLNFWLCDCGGVWCDGNVDVSIISRECLCNIY